MDYFVKITGKEYLTHDVIRFRLEKPPGFHFSAGQAVELTFDEFALAETRSPFTLTCLNTDPYLELIIKIYREHNGLTLALSRKSPGDLLIISEPWDSFKIKGPGTFIAGGTGITPFIAILRQLNVDHQLAGCQLFFSNKTSQDIFLAHEFSRLLGKRFINILTRENNGNGLSTRMNLEFFEKHVSDFAQPFYICGPGNFVEDIQGHLTRLGASKEMVELIL
jgi:ferredoxin-NADP reductase